MRQWSAASLCCFAWWHRKTAGGIVLHFPSMTYGMYVGCLLIIAAVGWVELNLTNIQVSRVVFYVCGMFVPVINCTRLCAFV